MLLTAWTLSPGGARLALRERALDLLLPLLSRQSGGGPDVVVVDIDRAALARFGPWPWPRRRMADLVAAAADGRPAVLALDILFAGPDRFSPDGDAALARALSMVPSVLGFVLDTTNSGVDVRTTPVLSRDPVSLPGLWRANAVIGPTNPLADAAQGMGALVAAADPDGPIRRIPLMVMTGATRSTGSGGGDRPARAGSRCVADRSAGNADRRRPRPAARSRCDAAPVGTVRRRPFRRHG